MVKQFYNKFERKINNENLLKPFIASNESQKAQFECIKYNKKCIDKKSEISNKELKYSWQNCKRKF